MSADGLTRIRAIHAAAREAMTDEEREAEDEHMREHALAALLADLGDEVPERPSAERVKDVQMELHATAPGSLGAWQAEFARDRLAVLALLEGDNGEEAAR